jgi:hypothetical protein
MQAEPAWVERCGRRANDDDVPRGEAKRRAHAAGVHRDELLVEPRKPPLILGDQQGIEGRQPVARDLKGDPPNLGQNPP